jgi:phosphoglycerate-specific signal transduction histidine kinase
MITCCEIALAVSVGAFTVILSLLAMFFNYNLKLDARTVKLEKKNGAERSQIEEQQKEIEKLKKTLTELQQTHEMSTVPKTPSPTPN